MSPGLRARLTVLLAGVLLGLVSAAAAAVLWQASLLPVWAAPVALAAAVTGGAAAGGLPFVRRHAALVLAAAAAAAAVVAAAAAGPVAALLVLGRLPDVDERGAVAAAAAGMLVVAVTAPALASWAGRAARRVAHGGRHGIEAVLDRFAAQAARGAPVEELLREFALALRRQWRAAAVELWSGDNGPLDLVVHVPADAAPPVSTLDAAAADRLRRAGVAGPGWSRMWLPQLLAADPGAQLRVVPVRHGEQLLALLVLRRAHDAQRFTPADDRTLADIAGRLGVALHNRRLDDRLRRTLLDLRRANTDLRASRSRLVAAADAERRRIERDLHDGAQQQLVSLAVGLGLLRATWSAGTRPDPMLDQLDELAARAAADLRDLAHGVYPALLRDAGLGQALPGAVERSGLRAGLDCTAERFPPPVEAALYFCCLEALQNIAKHARGATVTVRLRRAPGGPVLFEVADDGPGFDPATVPPGAGRQNMADRVGAVGGVLEIRSAPGQGTTVTASVPIAGDG